MNRVAVLAAVAVLAVVAVGAAVALRPAQPASLEARADALAAELRCPDCEGLSVADSPTAAAAEIRRQIEVLLAAGATDDGVRAHFTARYGEWILLAPTSPLVWIVPFAVVAVGAAGLVVWVLGRRHAPAPEAAPLSQAERRRIHEEAEAIDA